MTSLCICAQTEGRLVRRQTPEQHLQLSRKSIQARFCMFGRECRGRFLQQAFGSRLWFRFKLAECRRWQNSEERAAKRHKGKIVE